MRQRHALIARVAQLRRRGPAAASEAASEEAASEPAATISVLEGRIAHLEKVVEGLQDAVHRESSRMQTRIVALEAQLDPAALVATLNEDARRRGL